MPVQPPAADQWQWPEVLAVQLRKPLAPIMAATAVETHRGSVLGHLQAIAV